MSFCGIYNKYLRNKDVPTERRNVAVTDCAKKSKIARSTKKFLFMPITPFSNQRHPTHFVVEGHIFEGINWEGEDEEEEIEEGEG